MSILLFHKMEENTFLKSKLEEPGSQSQHQVMNSILSILQQQNNLQQFQPFTVAKPRPISICMPSNQNLQHLLHQATTMQA